MKREAIAILLGVLICTHANTAPVKHKPAKHEPDFSLTLSIKSSTIESLKGLMPIVVIATEKNISHHKINTSRTKDPGEWYRMAVVHDGVAAPITANYQRILHPPDTDSNSVTTWDGGMSLPLLDPGKSINFKVPLTAYFDFSDPGDYEVTFTRGTDPGQPDNVDVGSNTITINVLPEAAKNP